jgi:hypothetical protein
MNYKQKGAVDMKFEEFISKKLFLLRMIWVGMFFYLFVLSGIVFVIVKEPIELDLNSVFNGENPLVIALIAMAVTAAIGAFLVYDFFDRRILSERWNRDSFFQYMGSMRTKYGHVVNSPETLQQMQNFSDDQLKEINYYTRMLVANIIRFALTESIALFGFVLAISVKNIQIFFPFGIAAILMMIIFFPKRNPKFLVR